MTHIGLCPRADMRASLRHGSPDPLRGAGLAGTGPRAGPDLSHSWATRIAADLQIDQERLGRLLRHEWAPDSSVPAA